jgi:hypothetical protein
MNAEDGELHPATDGLGDEDLDEDEPAGWWYPTAPVPTTRQQTGQIAT